MATAVQYHAPATAHALSRPPTDASHDDGSDCESVAESSCPCPTARGFVSRDRDDDEEEDDDGCSSCVVGNDFGGCEQEGDEEDGEEVSTASVWWWKKRPAVAAGAGGAEKQKQWEVVVEVEDPERAAARQAEDRKFWEDCLGTGYP